MFYLFLQRYTTFSVCAYCFFNELKWTILNIDRSGVLKFENALAYSPEAQKGLDYIGLLYMLEANLKDEGAG
jgi:hypothetical protein